MAEPQLPWWMDPATDPFSRFQDPAQALIPGGQGGVYPMNPNQGPVQLSGVGFGGGPTTLDTSLLTANTPPAARTLDEGSSFVPLFAANAADAMPFGSSTAPAGKLEQPPAPPPPAPPVISAPFPSVAPQVPGVQPGGQEIPSPFAAPQPPQGAPGNVPWGNPSASRPIRLNNPGAIEFGPFAQQFGATGSDGRFARFNTPEEGFRAMEALLGSYLQRGLNTPQSIIGRWAPAPENDSTAYAARVARSLGIAPNTPISPADIPRLARAMAEVETGMPMGGVPQPAIRDPRFAMGEQGVDLAASGIPQGMGQPSPAMLASLTGAPMPGQQAGAPPPFSPTATALVPGLSQPMQGPPQGVARSGWMGLGDVLGFSERSGGQPMQSPADYFSHLAPNAQRAAAEVFQRGQELRMQNPQAPPEALQQMLIRDPVWGRNAINLGANAPSVLATAVNPVQTPGAGFTLNPGDRRFDAANRLVAEGGPPTPPQAALVQWLQSLPPEQQAEALRLLGASRPGTPPSDREQAIARLNAGSTDPNDLLLAGRIRPVTRTNQYGQIVTEGYIDVLTGQPVTVQPRSSVAPQTPPGGPPPGGPPAPVTAPPPAVTGAGDFQPPPGVTFGGITPRQPGEPLSPEVLASIQSGLMGGSPFNMFVGGQDGQGGLISLQSGTQAPGGPQAGAQDVGAPAPLDTRVRRMRLGDQEFDDVPGLSLRDTLLADPAEMFLAAGPFAAARSFYGRLAASLGGEFATTEEATQTRGIYLDSLRAALATLERGTRLAGEHETTMATIPAPESIRTSPVRAVGQGIVLRSRLVHNLALAQRQSQDPGLSETTRRAVSDRIAQIQEALQLMPTREAMEGLRTRLLRGERPPGTTMPGFGEVTAPLKAAAGEVTGQPGTTTVGPARIPEDLTGAGLTPARLLELAKQPNVSRTDMLRIQAELKRRRDAGQ